VELNAFKASVGISGFFSGSESGQSTHIFALHCFCTFAEIWNLFAPWRIDASGFLYFGRQLYLDM